MNSISPKELEAAAQKLPTSPRIFGKLSELMRDPNTELADITELVNADSALTASVLRLSNSAMFSMGMSVDTLDVAIDRIGFRELFRLVGIAAAAEVFTEDSRCYDVSASQLWENSLCCGIAMETLARKTGMDEQEAYTLGLLRNMGKMIIDHCAREKDDSPIYNKTSALPLLDWEANNFGITNATVSGFILETWNFSKETTHTIQYQYEPDKAPQSRPLINLLNLANGLASRIGRGLAGEDLYWSDWEKRLPRTGLSAEEFESVEEEIETEFKRVLSAFQ